MKKLAFASMVCAAVFGVVSVSSAAIMASFVPVLTEAATVPPPGFVSQDLSVTSTSDWTQAQLVVTLTNGSIYQDAAANEGTGAAPNPAFFGFVPTLRWDTYVTGWDPFQAASSAGGAVDIGGGAAAFSTSAISKQWFTTDIDDIGTSTLGRFTLSNNATGTWKLRLYDSTGAFVNVDAGNGQVAGGLLIVPEPGTIILAGLAIPAMAFAIRRRKVA